jgi:hypothetical protein
MKKSIFSKVEKLEKDPLSIFKKFKAFVKKLVYSNYTTYKIYNKYIENSKIDCTQKSLLVYTGVKTASSSVFSSLCSHNLDIPIYHIHFLSHQSVKKWDKIYRESFPRIHRIPVSIIQSMVLRNGITNGGDYGKWKIISGIRDPIAQHISWFFYGIDILVPSEISYERKINSLPPDKFANELIHIFLEEIRSKNYLTDSHLISWFDLELKHIFGIDICSFDFPKSQGYAIFSGNHPKILLYKVEALQKCSKEAFGEFLNLKNFAIGKANSSETKKYKNVYQNFLEKIRLPDDYINSMYSNGYVRHIYSQGEIESFKKKWKKAT